MSNPTDADPAPTEDQEILAANALFYHALETADLGQMEALWGDGDDVTCAHPGRGPLRGRRAVIESWAMIFGAGGNPQIIVTDTRVSRRGPVAWVTVTENLLSEGHAGAATAVNIFATDGDRWQIVAHHAGPIMA